MRPARRALLELADVWLGYGSTPGAGTVLQEVTFSVEQGESVGVVGASGSGKSTLGRAIAGVLPPSAWVRGKAVFMGSPLQLGLPARSRPGGSEIVYLVQESADALNPALSIGGQLVDVLRLRGLSRVEARRRSLELLDKVELENVELLTRAYPHQLSGGMRRRVLLALALACRPRLLIADEITAGLDRRGRERVLALARGEVAANGALVLITHSAAAASACDKTLRLAEGRVQVEVMGHA